jgi:hypothetical protein
MDSPKPPGKPRWYLRWFSPLRWRFWVVVFPLIPVTVGVVLFAWPGLVFEWKINDEWFIARSHDSALKSKYGFPSDVTRDYTYLAAGPFWLKKSQFIWKDESRVRPNPARFYTRDEPDSWRLFYETDNLYLWFAIQKAWSGPFAPFGR